MSATFCQQIWEAAKNSNDLYQFVNEKAVAYTEVKLAYLRVKAHEQNNPMLREQLKNDQRKAKLNYKTAKYYLKHMNEQKSKNHGTVVAIDLGTTNSCVSIFKDGRVEIIANDHGNRMTPSCVAFTPDGKRLIGDDAVNQLTSNPENTVFDVKRLIGREFSDPSVQQDIKIFPFKVIEKNSKPIIQINTGKEEKLFTPEEILAMILGKMREIAEGYLGKKITHAVVTVPAYFNNAQRQATKDAGTIAGLNVIRMFNEPTAAALYAFGLNKNTRKKKILVFHLGGGTFDVSLLKTDDDILKIVATDGNTHLGGEDFNQRVMEYFIKLFGEKTGKDVRTDNRAVQKLRREVEKAKRILSSQHQTNIEIESFFDNQNFSETLTREKFEELNLDLFNLTLVSLHWRAS